MVELHCDEIDSPMGALTLVAGGGALRALDFNDCAARMRALLQVRYGAAAPKRSADPHGFSSRLLSYLAGDVGALDSIPVELGGTPFQREVWAAVRRIPAGRTRTYGEIAAALGRPAAARAVGLANGQNPVCLVIPCHRVLGAGGALTGYAGGIERKRWLLAHEGAAAPGGARRAAANGHA
jgi:methylated-DNA-[protein]-cysteine S-methyltransferase